MSNAPVDPLEQQITLLLSAREVNYIMAALGQMPFQTVVGLIGKIKMQGETQFVPPPPAPASEPTDGDATAVN